MKTLEKINYEKPVYYYTNSDTVIIILHGWLDSCHSVRFITQNIIDNGYSVAVPNLLGHGTVYTDLKNVGFQDWLDQIEELYQNLSAKYTNIFFIGYSLGGTISLNLAEKYNSISGIVLINHVVKFAGSIFLTPFFQYLISYVPNVKNDLNDKQFINEFVYKKFPVRNSAQLLKIARQTRINQDKCQVPVLIFKSRQDHRIPFINGSFTFNNIGSKNKELVYLENSFHMAALDFDKDIIIKKSLDFVKKNIKNV